MNTKMKNAYGVFTFLAFIAVIVVGISTYDMAVHLSPIGVKLFGVAVPKESIGYLTLLVMDGLYLALDWKLPVFRTVNARTAAIGFMIFLWAGMVSVNLASAVINKTMDTSALGNFSWVVYIVKMAALLYLAFYTYIRFDDPDTKRQIIEVESRELRQGGINNYVKQYSQSFAQVGGKIVAMEETRKLIEKETGREIQTILGKDWANKIAALAGVDWEGVNADAGNSATGNPSQSTKTKQLPVVPPAEADNFLQKGVKALQSLVTGNSNFH